MLERRQHQKVLAMILAGGSAGINNIFVALGFRCEIADRSLAWQYAISVAPCN